MLMDPTPSHPEKNADELASQRKALAQNWVQCQPAVSAYIGAFVTDFHVAQDLLQEVAEAVATHFHKYDPDRPFLSWTLGIARRRIMRHYRSRSRDRHVYNSEMMETVANAFERAAPLASQRREAIRECIRGVHGRRREVLELRYAADLKPQAIAEQLGISGESVRSLLLRCRKSLERCVKKRLALLGVES